jgi:hypothetical protein
MCGGVREMDSIIVEFFDQILHRVRRVEGTQIYPPTAAPTDIPNPILWVFLFILLCIPIVVGLFGYICYKGITIGMESLEEGKYFEAIGYFALPAIIVGGFLCSMITKNYTNSTPTTQASNVSNAQYNEIKERASMHMEIANNFPVEIVSSKRVNCEYFDDCKSDSLGKPDDSSYIVTNLLSHWAEGASISDAYTSIEVEDGSEPGIYNCSKPFEIPAQASVELICKDEAVAYKDGQFTLNGNLQHFPEDICLTIFLYVPSDSPIYGMNTPKKNICIDIETP